MKSLPQKHREETERLIKLRSSTEEGLQSIVNWILNEGFYPEPYVLPPTFTVSDFNLDETERQSFFKENGKDRANFQDFKLAKISYPKSGYIERTFGVIHPKRYHDIVYWLKKDWSNVIAKLFDSENKIYSYSFPIPVSSADEFGVSTLRSGRMIYEFLEMAEKDLVAESHAYKVLAKIDITNFYNSVYTHTIHWAWLGDRKKAADEKKFGDLGAKLDKLFHYSNDRRTNGIAVGPVLSDLIVELILSERDKMISKKLNEIGIIDFVATRFKDDYRFLCKSDEEADRIIKVIIEVLGEYNLQVNEQKTKKLPLPDGLYRPHNQKYQTFSLRRFPFDEIGQKIPFKIVETTLLRGIELHREYPGTSLLEKFLGELIDKKTSGDIVLPIWDRLKIEFVNTKIPEDKKQKSIETNVKKFISLLIHLTKESPKSLAKVLSIFEIIHRHPNMKWLAVEDYLKSLSKKELVKALSDRNIFESLWWLYFIKKHDFEDSTEELVTLTSQYESVFENPFIKTILGHATDLFDDEDHSENLIRAINECEDLVDYLEIFHRNEVEVDS